MIFNPAEQLRIYFVDEPFNFLWSITTDYWLKDLLSFLSMSSTWFPWNFNYL